MQAFLDMKSEWDLDINDGVRFRGLDRSKLGSHYTIHVPTNYKEIVIQRGKTF